jgi:hypothetical protein
VLNAWYDERTHVVEVKEYLTGPFAVMALCTLHSEDMGEWTHLVHLDELEIR